MKLAIKIILIVCAFSSIKLDAQTFRFGAIGAMNISKLSNSQNSSYNFLGYKLGTRVSANISKHCRLRTDLQISRKGNTENESLSINFPFENTQLDYIEFPIAITYTDWMDDPNETDYFRLHFTSGITFGKLISYKVVNEIGTDITDMKDFNSTLISAFGGLTYFVNSHFGIELTYNHSFTNLLDDDAIVRKDRTWSLGIVYMINNKKYI